MGGTVQVYLFLIKIRNWFFKFFKFVHFLNLGIKFQLKVLLHNCLIGAVFIEPKICLWWILSLLEPELYKSTHQTIKSSLLRFIQVFFISKMFHVIIQKIFQIRFYFNWGDLKFVGKSLDEHDNKVRFFDDLFSHIFYFIFT